LLKTARELPQHSIKSVFEIARELPQRTRSVKSVFEIARKLPQRSVKRVIEIARTSTA
jgi:hypothetical protein